MVRRALLVVALAAVAAPAASAAPATTKKQAIAIVRGILGKQRDGCNITAVYSITATSSAVGWHVTAKIRDNGHRDTVKWTVVGKRAVPNDPLAAEIAVGCP